MRRRTRRGSQYCGHDYQQTLRQHRLTASMRGYGNWYENLAVESVFNSPKAELIWRRGWQSRQNVKTALFPSDDL